MSLDSVVPAPLPKPQPAAGARLNSPSTVCDSSNLEVRLAGVFHQRANPLKSFRGRRPPGRKDSCCASGHCDALLILLILKNVGAIGRRRWEEKKG